MRRRLSALVMAVLATAATAGPAHAATEDISIVGITEGFSPKTARDPFGTTFTWTNDDSIAHTTTQDSPLALWSSGTLAAGDTYSITIDSAGKFAYHCAFHPGMTGTIRIPVEASPDSGSVSTAFTIGVAAAAAPDGFTYDVQRKKDGGTWRDWKTGVTKASLTLRPRSVGVYRFRARLTRTSDDSHSGWSPADTVTVS